MKEQVRLNNVIVSVDSSEWYYGRREFLTDNSNRTLVREPVSENDIVSAIHAREINDLLAWIDSHERDTMKKKKRLLYVDVGFFVSKNR